MAFVGRAILPGNPARSRLSAGFCDNDGVRRESRSRLACGWQSNPLLSTRLELPESSLNRAPEHARQPQVIQSGPAGGPAESRLRAELPALQLQTDPLPKIWYHGGEFDLPAKLAE